METLEYDHNLFSPQQADADRNLAVRFFSQPVKDDMASIQEGRPIFQDTDMVEIRVRGDRNNIVVKPATNEHKARFRGAWEAYRQGRDVQQSGTPLLEWPPCTKSMVEELKYLGFHTVEQVAGASDSVCSKFAGLTNLKVRAQAFLEYAKNAAPIEQFQAQIENFKAQKEVDAATISDLSKRLTELESKYHAMLEAKVAPAAVKK